jgi:hypothetical protein
LQSLLPSSSWRRPRSRGRESRSVRVRCHA